MVRNKKTTTATDDQEEIEITTDNTEPEFQDPDLTSVEENDKDIISSLKTKLKNSESEKRQILEDSQRLKADYLNARRRLDEDRERDKVRSIISHLDRLIPVYDSFEMAMANKTTWEKAEENWRKGVEGIYAQLLTILTDYRVTTLNPLQETFDPKKHEALSTIPVTDDKDHDKVMTVIQKGYELRNNDGTAELIRPARVIIGNKD